VLAVCVSTEEGLVAVEETAARAAMAVGLAGIGTAVAAGAVWLDYAVATATAWIPLNRFVVPAAVVVGLSYGPLRSLFVRTVIVDTSREILPRILGTPERFEEIETVGADFRLLYYVFFALITHIVSLSAHGLALDAAATCGGTSRFLVPQCPLLSVTVILFDVAVALVWVSSSLLLLCSYTAVGRWLSSRLTSDSDPRWLDLPWTRVVDVLPATVTADTDGDVDHSVRRYTADFLRRAAAAGVVAAAATATLVVGLTRLARPPAVSWTGAHIRLFTIVSLAVAAAGVLRRQLAAWEFVDAARSRASGTVRRFRRLWNAPPAAGFVVSVVTLTAGAACLWLAVTALPTDRRPPSELLGGPLLPPAALGYWSVVHHLSIVGTLASGVVAAHDAERWYRTSTLADAVDGFRRVGRSAFDRGRGLWREVMIRRPEAASRWYVWVRICTLGELLFFGLAVNEALFGDPFRMLLVPVAPAVVLGTLTAWLDCRTHRATLSKRTYARLGAVGLLPPFGGVWYLVTEYPPDDGPRADNHIEGEGSQNSSVSETDAADVEVESES
jgi:hypothetical protein